MNNIKEIETINEKIQALTHINDVYNIAVLSRIRLNGDDPAHLSQDSIIVELNNATLGHVDKLLNHSRAAISWINPR